MSSVRMAADEPTVRVDLNTRIDSTFAQERGSKPVESPVRPRRYVATHKCASWHQTEDPCKHMSVSDVLPLTLVALPACSAVDFHLGFASWLYISASHLSSLVQARGVSRQGWMVRMGDEAPLGRAGCRTRREMEVDATARKMVLQRLTQRPCPLLGKLRLQSCLGI